MRLPVDGEGFMGAEVFAVGVFAVALAVSVQAGLAGFMEAGVSALEVSAACPAATTQICLTAVDTAAGEVDTVAGVGEAMVSERVSASLAWVSALGVSSGSV